MCYKGMSNNSRGFKGSLKEKISDFGRLIIVLNFPLYEARGQTIGLIEVGASSGATSVGHYFW